MRSNNSKTPHWTQGINRREFLKTSLAVSLLTSLSGCKPVTPKQNLSKNEQTVAIPYDSFNEAQLLDLQAISMRLFPDDGDGPSANDLNFLTYLQWAMTDKQNSEDGDPEFLAQGIVWLNQFASDDYGHDFKSLPSNIQDEIIQKTAQSEAGERWLALLLYYLLEALTLDPYYGGNPKQIGWQWLQHQGGFPHPEKNKTYRDFP